MSAPSNEADDLAPLERDTPLPWAPLESYLRASHPELAGPLELLAFRHGSANLKYLARFGDRELVVRRPPFGTLPPGAHDMTREYKVLSRLWQAYPRAPRVFDLCRDHAVFGADLVVMERRRGVVVRSVVPPSMVGLPDLGRRLSLSLLDATTALHQVDPDAIGLSDLGKPNGFAERQLTGWRKRWDLVKFDEMDADAQAIADRLRQGIPVPSRVSIVHNDLKIDNCQYADGDPDHVTTVFDWDMATLGDPLADLGTLLNYWPDPSDPPELSRGANREDQALGLITRAELTARYLERMNVTADSVRWWEAFALWKTAVVMAQLNAAGSKKVDRATMSAQSLRLIRTAKVVLGL